MIALNVGDAVRYCPAFCARIVAPRYMRARRGIVARITEPVRPNGPRVVYVQWSGVLGSAGVLSCNLKKA
jgi:hypothetical protein